MNITRLQLLESDVKGFLNIKGDSEVPLNFSVSDIRDVSSRSGMFSKTITLAGDKNNNNILNNYFDVNIVDGTFDVNKRQKVAIVQNGVILRDNCFMRLLKVVKKQSVDTNIDELVEYEVQVTDELGDFFKTVGNNKLEQLTGWDVFNHKYTAESIIASFGNTVDDGYKYALPWIDKGEYYTNELMASIYAKQIFDRIHQQNGYSYEWATISDTNFQFDKSIIPYSGDKKKLSQKYINETRIEAEDDSVQVNDVKAPVAVPTFSREKLTIATNIVDPQNNYSGSTSEFNNPFIIMNPDSMIYTIDVEYEISVINKGTSTVSPLGNTTAPGVLTNVGNGFKPDIAVYKNGVLSSSAPLKNGTINKFQGLTGTDAPLNGKDLVYKNNNDVYTVNARNSLAPLSSMLLLTGTEQVIIPVGSLNIGDVLDVRSSMNGIIIPNIFGQPVNAWYVNGGAITQDVDYVLTILSVKLRIEPAADNGLMIGTEINLRDLLPNKMKQSEFLKSIYQKYNLYVEIDETNSNRLIYTSRDDFYDKGKVVDLTKKLDKKKEQELYFLPDITTKKIALSYKDDSNDIMLDSYKSQVGKTFGEVDVTFKNQNVKGDERKEESFSPTISMRSGYFGAVLPVLDPEFKMEVRYLQDGGQLTCGNYQIKEGNTIYNLNTYPHLSMFDRPDNPTFSIEYAQSSFYAYNPGLVTQNNLYNIHWRRTMSQMDSGKMLKAYFWLDENDIQRIKLNDKIKINNAFYYINSIIDYDANSNKSTKIELLTVEDDIKLVGIGERPGVLEPNIGAPGENDPSGPFNPNLPNKPGGFTLNDTKKVIERRDNGSTLTMNSNSGGIYGFGNTVPDGFKGVVVGDGMTVTEDGVFTDGTSIVGDSITTGNVGSGNGSSINFDGDIITVEGDTLDLTNINVIGLDGIDYGNIYYVTVGGDDSTGERGSMTKTFATISGARNKVHAEIVDNIVQGVTLIYVYPGDYTDDEMQYENGNIYFSPGAKVTGIARTDSPDTVTSMFYIGGVPKHNPMYEANNFNVFGYGDFYLPKTTDNDWNGSVISVRYNAKCYFECNTITVEKGTGVYAGENAELNLRGNTFKVEVDGYVTTVRDNSNTTFDFQRIYNEGTGWLFFLRQGTMGGFLGSCVVNANIISTTGTYQTLRVQQARAGCSIIINCPKILATSYFLDVLQSTGGNFIINGNVFGANGLTVASSHTLNITMRGDMNVNGTAINLSTNNNANNSLKLNYFGDIRITEGFENPIRLGRGTLRLNGSIYNSDISGVGVDFNGIRLLGDGKLIIDNFKAVVDKYSVSSDVPRDIKVIHSFASNKPMATGVDNIISGSNVIIDLEIE